MTGTVNANLESAGSDQRVVDFAPYCDYFEQYSASRGDPRGQNHAPERNPNVCLDRHRCPP
ncbi:hypothetical protein TRAPUB_10006 [Trametes pubescens]|uniref:Uncharacterized protein n=1 Tax=Trametes pubescens TaxID=154538 RepID=A0A1M2W107_TRAPU|nr:hypothetical protein TRAPUB_10006 [Trametes pubescens]